MEHQKGRETHPDKQLASHSLLFAGFGYLPLRNQSKTEQRNN